MYINIKEMLRFSVKKMRSQLQQWPVRIVTTLFVIALTSVVIFIVVIISDGVRVQELPRPVTKAFQESGDTIPPHYVRRALDGLYVSPEAANLYPVAVMIDNDPLARPQAGLAHAQLVYEARAEAGITRFMAVFAGATTTPAVIGPVRSARPYFVDWARGLNALYAHVGGSPEALDILRSITLLNINEFYQGGYFWRERGRPMPHNVYTAAENFYTYLERLNAVAKSFESWQYKDEPDLAQRGSTDATINYSVANFLVEWRYDKEKNHYVRFMGGTPHNDIDGASITAKNIVVMQVHAVVIDDEFRRRMDTVGEGRAWYCFDGICREGVWKKPAKDVREKIYAGDGLEVIFNAGTTWVQVVQYEEDVTFSE